MKLKNFIRGIEDVKGQSMYSNRGASGIGLAIAESFSREGAKVVMADINEEKVNQESELDKIILKGT